MTPNNIPEKKPEDMVCPSWRICEIHTTEKPCPHHSPHALNAGCNQTCFFASGDCIQIPENMKTRAQLQQEHEVMPIEEYDPFACDCERCVREQRRIVNMR